MKDSWLRPAVTLPHSDRIVMSTDPGGQQKARGMWAFFSAARSHARYSEFCLSSGPKESALERKVRVRSPRRTLGSETHPEAERESEQSSQGKETLCAITPGDPRGGEKAGYRRIPHSERTFRTPLKSVALGLTSVFW